MSFAVDHVKSRAYDQIAELAVAAKIKSLRASESDDIRAILNTFFHQSLGVMRRTGLAVTSLQAGSAPARGK